MSENVSLIDRIGQIIGSDDFNLPVFSDVAVKVRQVVSAEDYKVRDVEQVIGSDQSLASEVLRVANSAFYGGLAKIATVRDAAVRLGAKQLAEVVMVAAERNRYTARDPEIQAMLVKLWHHAAGVALASQWLANKLGYQDKVDEALLGGLLHDIGKLGALKVIDHIKEKEGGQFQAEFVLEVIDAVHTAEGYKLAQKWRLPENYCVIVRDHHLEDFDKNNHVLMLIRLADAACTKLGIGLHQDASLDLAVLPESHGLGVGEVILAELEIMLEDGMAALGA